MLEFYFKGNYQKWYDEDYYEMCLWIDDIEIEFPLIFDNWKLILVKNNALNDLSAEYENYCFDYKRKPKGKMSKKKLDEYIERIIYCKHLKGDYSDA